MEDEIRAGEITSELLNTGDFLFLEYQEIVHIDKIGHGRQVADDGFSWGHEYVHQSTGSSGDNFYGDLFIPYKDDLYFKFAYEM